MGLSRDMVDQLRHLLRPLQTRVANLAARAVVQLCDDSTRQQLLQVGVLAGEDIDDAEHFQEYGFSSVPLAGAEAVVLFPNGDRGHPLVVAVADRRHRPTGGEPGEVSIYNHTGARVTLTAAGDIVVTPAPGRFVRQGSEAASTPVALTSELLALKALIAAWVPSSGDGGASLKSVIAGWLAPGTTKVRAE